MAGGKTSKTARASTRAGATGAAGAFIRSADASLFIPTGAGEYTYVYTADGKSMHGRVGSEKVMAAVKTFVGSQYADRALVEAQALAAKYPVWSVVVEMLAPAADTVDA